MMKSALLVPFAILACSLIAFAQQKTDEQYWSDTGIDLNYVGGFLDQHCHASAMDFVACVQGLDAAAGLMKPDATFAAPAQSMVPGNHIGSAIKQYGPLSLYNIIIDNNPNPSISAAWQQVVHERAAQIKALTEIYTSGEGTQIKFSEILSEWKPEIIKGDLAQSEALIAGRIVNTYIASAKNPHDHWDPAQQDIDSMSAKNAADYAGLGIRIQLVGQNIMVQSPMRGSPALKAGIRAGDTIETVDGVHYSAKEEDAAVKAMKGKAGTTVTLGISRDGKSLSIPVEREQIQIPVVDARLVNDLGVPMLYIKLDNFMETAACEQIASAISKYAGENFQAKFLNLVATFNHQQQTNMAQGIILDLRDNGGGLVPEAVCIGALFVGKQVIVQMKDFDEQIPLEQVPFQKQLGTTDAITDLPMVTLINGWSASASEMLAGALQDYKRSWMAGQRSFGKASAQGMEHTFLDKKINSWETIARFYEPSGRTNQIVGIVPDLPLDPKPNATADDLFFPREEGSYTNALPPLGSPWSESRPQDVKKMQNCMTTKSGAVINLYNEQSKNDALAPDYEVLQSQNLLNCAIQLQKAHELKNQ